MAGWGVTAPPERIIMKLRILQNFNGLVDGKSIPFKAEQIVSVPDIDAAHFVNGGYAVEIEAIKPEPAKIAHKRVKRK